MAVEVIRLLQEQALRFGASGIECSVPFLVTGFTAPDEEYQVKILRQKGVPRRGDPHPADPSMQADDFDVKNEGLIGRVTVSYRVLNGIRMNISDTEPALITVGSSLVDVESEVDINGDEIFTEHTYPDKLDASGRPKTLIQTATVRMRVPLHTITCTRREPKDPSDKSIEFTGATNAGTWRGKDEGTWLCVGIGGPSNDNGASFMVGHEFHHRPEGWDTVVVQIDPDTGRRVLKPIWGKGIKKVQMTKRLDFASLKLGKDF